MTSAAARHWRCLAAASALALLPHDGARAADLTVNLGRGVVLKPYGLYQLDGGGIDNSAPGGQSAGTNARRLRTGARLAYLDQVEAGLIWDFGHTPGGQQRLFEAQATYRGLKPLAFTAGVFKPSFGLESMQGAGDTLFLERASISTLTRDIAAGIGRQAVQARASGPRYHAAVSLTAGTAGPGQDGDQRAVVARVAGLALHAPGATLHLGVSGEYVFRPQRNAGRTPSLTLSDQPELQIDDVPEPLSTGPVATRRAAALGPEAAIAAGRLFAQAEYYEVLLDQRTDAGGGTLRFNGWYTQAAYTLAGRPRTWKPDTAAWSAPTPTDGFDPRAGHWGALELAARFSTVDLDSGTVRGGRQSVWTAGVNWFPIELLQFKLQYQHADITGGPSPRSSHAVAGRAQLQF